MDTADKVEQVAEVKKSPGRPKKQDPSTPLGEHIAQVAKQQRKRREENKVLQKYYELRGSKLSLCKVLSSGTVFKTFVGSTSDKKSGTQVREFIKKLEGEGRLRVKV